METGRMFRRLVVLFGVVLVVTVAGGAGAGIQQTPEGLDAYYPPVADAPVYLFRMLDLERAFSGIAAELTENDAAGAREQYRVFSAAYRSAKGMVGEWKDEFPEEAVEALGRALETGDQAALTEALNGVGTVCHRCHVAAMVPTQQKYRWGNFAALAVVGQAGQAEPFGAFKKAMATSMAGLDVDAGQAQWEHARRHFRALKQSMAALSGTCVACHGEKPAKYTDPAALPLLERELEQELPDRAAVSGLLKAFGGQACAGCHLIHVPAAMRAAVSN